MGVREYRDIPRVYIDMDGPMADFEREVIRSGKSAYKIKLMPDTYRNLMVTPGAREAMTKILNLPVEVWFLTKPPRENRQAPGEKSRWQQENFPEIGDRIIITPDKGAIGSPRDSLVDDHPSWANANQFPGEIILFTATYNSDGTSLNNWDKVVNRLRAKYR